MHLTLLVFAVISCLFMVTLEMEVGKADEKREANGEQGRERLIRLIKSVSGFGKYNLFSFLVSYSTINILQSL